ncbi:hypothetical protein SPFM20_00153 [Salmonella phage SPFM20]|nr:hypothetical protein SPFM20_00153 [Salmonella phage SPFM20]
MGTVIVTRTLGGVMILIANIEALNAKFLGDEYCVRTQGREYEAVRVPADMLLQSFVPLRAEYYEIASIHEIQKYLLEGGKLTDDYQMNCY